MNKYIRRALSGFLCGLLSSVLLVGAMQNLILGIWCRSPCRYGIYASFRANATRLH